MKPQPAFNWLVPVVAILTASAAGFGLFWSGGDGPFQFTTLHDQTIEIYGIGLYQYDTPLSAVGYRVGDAFTLIAAIPGLLLSWWMYRRGTMRGKLLLTGTFLFLLYNYGSLAIGAAYNNLFLLYILLTMGSFLGAASLLLSFDVPNLPRLFSEQAPWRGISNFFIVSGFALFSIWLFLSILPALLAGAVPSELGSYTTMITYVVDMGIIAPVLVSVGILLHRRQPLGYLLTSVLLVFIDILGSALLVMGIAQKSAGLVNIGQFLGFVISFAVLTFFSIGLTVGLFRNLAKESRSVQQFAALR